MNKREPKYDASSIEVLSSDVARVRHHPAMYLGALGNRGVFQSFKELADNANDEVSAARGERLVFVRVDYDRGTVLVADTGRGIPVEVHAKTKLSGVETVMTMLHAGAKSYKSSKGSAYGKNKRGVHGVGASVTNALAKRLDLWTRRNGAWHHIAFEKGKTVEKLSRVKRVPVPWPKRGTIIEYVVDESVLQGELELASVVGWCDTARYFSPATIRLEVVRGKKSKTREFAPREPYRLLKKRMVEHDVSAVTDPIVVTGDGVRLVMAWTGASECHVYGSVSGSPTSGGTHMRGLEAAVRGALEKVAKRRAKRDGAVDPLVGLFAVLDVTVEVPSFEGQAKDRLASKGAHALVRDTVQPVLAKWVRKNRAKVVDIIEHARKITKIDDDAKSRKKMARETVQKGARLSLPKGFKAASSYPASERETYLVEGNSAAGTAKDACMPHQEVLPLRGKIPNVVKDGAKARTNEVIKNIVTVTGYDARNPKRKLRTGKLILLTDADQDGDHIAVLILAVVKREMPELLEQGLLYVVDAPLFEAYAKGTMVLGNVLADMRKQHGKLTHVNRMKGWGSCEAPVLRMAAFNPATRRLLRVSPASPKEGVLVDKLMGDNTDARKKLIGLR